MADHYQVLGIERTAGSKAIARAYREKALRWHPDKNRGDEERAKREFGRVFEAYEVLRDEESKAIYDERFRAMDERKRREGQMDAERLRMKRELDAREKSVDRKKVPTQDRERQLAEEIERLREMFRASDREAARVVTQASEKRKREEEALPGAGDVDESHQDYEERVLAALLRKARKTKSDP